ncbi:TPA: hypothetical protein ACM5DN_001110 [Escherichia coli]|uniref:hypothetical protein n=1 Tax=Escherichia coli TaxID=562 RepID=UPI000987A5F0|nr:hypothetical protein [Escherichia coli]KAA1839084.1 hypothetical protein EA250_08930 [Escherichia coli]MDB7111881.1 hypothetical protein [Escherichia coli]OOJ97802.1 hypothetical protein BMT78_03810 [Escherichia coli]RBY28012.1 hypothetical protein DS975_06220 [Escherichia coli]RBY68931.1 hypothetical protein DS979_07645 [Escherichia coli]
MKRAGEAGKALRAGGGADFIFSASQRVVTALSLPVEALVCLRGVKKPPAGGDVQPLSVSSE